MLPEMKGRTGASWGKGTPEIRFTLDAFRSFSSVRLFISLVLAAIELAKAETRAELDPSAANAPFSPATDRAGLPLG